ncbi:MAG: helix-turn-helix transcriptional regulator, partial [Rickettsiaceae bacterium]|nr:helix-turn-helix transcriptional regulator [Rickettsiaceae bacterium]
MSIEEGLDNKSILEISGIKFTPREIEVMSYILYGKTPGAIANFLSTANKAIELRTVNTHIQNIRRKIKASARVTIIDFIEKSDKHKILRNHYLDLLVKREFDQMSHIREPQSYYAPNMIPTFFRLLQT